MISTYELMALTLTHQIDDHEDCFGSIKIKLNVKESIPKIITYLVKNAIVNFQILINL